MRQSINWCADEILGNKTIGGMPYTEVSPAIDAVQSCVLDQNADFDCGPGAEGEIGEGSPVCTVGYSYEGYNLTFFLGDNGH